MIREQDLLQAAPAGGLFRQAGIPWRVSPQPLRLPRRILRRLEGLGHILARFQDASHALYRRALRGECAPWLPAILEAGKADWLVQCQRSKALAQEAPRIIRPDLLLRGEEMALSELDSVPGGLGISLWLARVYSKAGFDILGGAEGILKGFRAAHPQGACIAVSQESADYLPEMRYLAQQLGADFPLCRAEELQPDALAGRCLYRFFELFDHEAIPAARDLLEQSAAGRLQISPPALEHLEEKAWLALFHYPALQSYWRQALRGSHWDCLRRIIPHSWLLDPSPLPPQAAYPWLGLHSWQELAELGQKERRLVLKISGFDPRAWGGRGVYIGHDMKRGDWQRTLQTALADFPRRLWLLQDFREASLVEHPYYNEQGQLQIMQGRVRLCPYYFRHADGRCQLGGCLATIAPQDKKKIHGMQDAVLVPCLAS